MQRNLHWKGIEEGSEEKCVVSMMQEGVEISSVIVGHHGHVPFRVEYTIRTNSKWETRFFQLHMTRGAFQQHLLFESDGQGNWQSNGKSAAAYKGCLDVDLPLTPFTNSLPIHRLRLGVGEEQEIRVLYVDLLENEIKAVRQKYVRLSHTRYQYQNVPNDFEATITVDEEGFVVDYPGLFVKTV